ncbi:MAG TPA: Ig-like domain-containing protein [Terriglobales bacterium]|nr:Ig-like domain-containing protein [Terriglobales bacterium]
MIVIMKIFLRAKTGASIRSSVASAGAIERTARGWLATIAIIGLLLGSQGCGDFFTDPELTSITLSPTSPLLAIGNTQQLTATGNFDDDSTSDVTRSVTWTTSDNAIAQVNTEGLVTGVAAGTATITATSNSITGTATVTVTAATVQSIAVTPSTSTITSGQTQAFTATATLTDSTTLNLTNSVTWRSSDTNVATISSSGIATAQTVTSTVTTNITATSGNVTSNAAVLTVNP